MNWIKNQDGFVVDSQTGEMICLMAKTEDKLRDKIVEVAPELFTIVISFVESLDSGKFTAKSTYNDLKDILKRIPPELLTDERLTQVA